MAEASELQWEKEKKLWLAMSSGDEEAREQLILAYRPLVYWVAKKFRVNGQRFSDLVQEGTLALIRAVDKFDVSLGHRFTTYACYRIRGQMLNFLQRVEAKAPIPVDVECEDGDETAEFREVEEIIMLREGLLQLPEREAHILRELVIECRNARELAEEMSLDVSHVYRLKKKALTQLKEWFSQEYATSGAAAGIIR
ncbi:sigma-70 family RNA polymerase sigma factor [Pyramidobacter sp. SM-530-WT-4B]|uniref:Sigma-70 family RNA polymerase sigma factor n=1 Tax=Pyramidobacter porci TaxID=2605789 RepID=A0A6L5Y9E3_9BACT|nr:sigma-70 family RNA polymerase sigma factor [Pyramidobacter porci]MCI6260082.1 sigma-70 family RNA polymerase sigma factor [Pyramidobacter sp.]MDY2648748.1 sigma-70 family RNA polymerase sigma factor [Pyramidobacter porci]MST54608.1 sigma-70 family RNA polymerase sigma factor [Pyramidobacter porci]